MTPRQHARYVKMAKADALVNGAIRRYAVTPPEDKAAEPVQIKKQPYAASHKEMRRGLQSKESLERWGKRRADVIEFLRDGKKSLAEVAKATGLGPTATQRLLRKMWMEKMIDREQVNGYRSKSFIYFLGQ